MIDIINLTDELTRN